MVVVVVVVVVVEEGKSSPEERKAEAIIIGPRGMHDTTEGREGDKVSPPADN